MTILKKLFIKNYQDVKNPKVRLSYGITAGVIGIISNAVLFALKLMIGLISGSITIIADAVNNISDAGSSIITLVGFKLSARPADKEHPYGHARFEYVSGLIVAIVILIVGVLLGKSSIEKIITPDVVEPSVLVYVILGLSVIIKFFQMLVYRNFGKSIDSGALLASSQDSRNDILSTIAVIISAVIISFTHYYRVDGIAGLLVSIFIVISSIMLIKDTINPLLGEKPEKELIDEIRKKILSYDGVLGIHDLMVHSYGSGQCFAIAHVEVSNKEDIMIAHDLIDNIERDFKVDLGIHLAIHMDPIDVTTPETIELKEKIVNAYKEKIPQVAIHDFRVVYGVTHTNILFDATIPFDSSISKENVVEIAEQAVKTKDKTYFFVVDIDRDYE